MSLSFVVGIADNINDAQRVCATLVAAGLDHARLAVVIADETSSSAPSELGMRLFRVESGRGDEGMIVESGGTQVPMSRMPSSRAWIMATQLKMR